MNKRVLFLDAGETLFTGRQTRDQVYANCFREGGVEVEDDVMALWRAEEHGQMPEVFEGHLRYSEGWFFEFVRRLLRRAKSEADVEALRSRLASHFSRPEAFIVHEDTFPALDALTEMGMRLAVVSNWSDRLTPVLDGLRLTPYFEQVFISAVVGYSKPDTRLFLHAAQAMGVAPSETIHVGDDEANDWLAAKATGIEAYLLVRGHPIPHEPHILTSLNDLMSHLHHPAG